MREITLKVRKRNVYDQVARETSYIGARSGDPQMGYEKVFTTDEDQEALERSWAEAYQDLCRASGRWLLYATPNPESHGIERWRDLTVHLEVPDSFNGMQTPALESSLFSYFTHLILSRWLVLLGDGERGGYHEKLSEKHMEDYVQRLYSRKPPRYKRAKRDGKEGDNDHTA